MDRNNIEARLASLPGHVGVYYKNLVTGETFSWHGSELFDAASVIKLPIYAVVMKLCAEGRLSLDQKLLCRDEDKLPPSGALCFFSGELELDIRTLAALMISISDNTAANLLIRMLGINLLNEQFREIGLSETRMERLLFDMDAKARGRENRFAPEEIGSLLERIVRGEFISRSVSKEMQTLLLTQQISHKIPGYLPEGTPVMHKTGEDDGITHDVGVVLGDAPFVLCFAAERTDVPAAERALRTLALDLMTQC